MARGQQVCKPVCKRLTSTKKRSIHMPKMKTKSSAKKRFRVRPGGTVKRGQAFKRHILTKKTTKNKRHLRGAAAHARHKKVLALAKGFRGRRGNVFRIAKQAVMKAGQYAYRDRRAKKR